MKTLLCAASNTNNFSKYTNPAKKFNDKENHRKLKYFYLEKAKKCSFTKLSVWPSLFRVFRDHLRVTNHFI